MRIPRFLAGYPLVFIGIVAAFVLCGALAITLLRESAGPAFPVTVFGNARNAEADVSWVRNTESVALRQANLAAINLLPLTAADLARSATPTTAADSLYAALAGGSRRMLERARAAVRTQQQETALALYDTLAARHPENRALLLEHASVFASLGRHSDAAKLLRARMDDFPTDASIRLLAANNLWWSGAAFAADSVLDLVLALEPDLAEAHELRATIRPTMTPDVATAVRWAAADSGATEQLLAARALVANERYGEALAYYRRAIANSAQDSLLLELASAAAAADSLALLETVTRQYVARHPTDTDALLRVAQAYTWQQDYPRALSLYSELIAQQPSWIEARRERANVLLWSGRNDDAARELEVLLSMRPGDASAHKLLGDLASYRADWTTAREHYLAAARTQPLDPAITAGLTHAEHQIEAARVAALPQPAASAYVTTLAAYTDNQGFGFMHAEARRSFRSGRAAAAILAQQSVLRKSSAGVASMNPGYGVRFEGSYFPAERIMIGGSIGTEQFDLIGGFNSWSAEVSFFDYLGVDTRVEYEREPAARRTTSLVALYAETTSDVLRVSANAQHGRWSAWGQVEGERLESTLGGTDRILASASVQRRMSDAITAGLSISAQRADGAAPILPEWGALYWSPEYYVEPAVSLGYRRSLGSAWQAGATVAAGAGIIKERADAERRFQGNIVPTGSARLDLSYTHGPWSVSVGGAYGGALQQPGYRAGTFTLQASYTLPR